MNVTRRCTWANWNRPGALVASIAAAERIVVETSERARILWAAAEVATTRARHAEVETAEARRALDRLAADYWRDL